MWGVVGAKNCFLSCRGSVAEKEIETLCSKTLGSSRSSWFAGESCLFRRNRGCMYRSAMQSVPGAVKVHQQPQCPSVCTHAPSATWERL